MLIFLFPGTITRVFGVLRCSQIDGIEGHVLTFDVAFECYTAKHWRYVGCAIAILFVYGVGFPLYLFVALLRERRRRQQRCRQIEVQDREKIKMANEKTNDRRLKSGIGAFYARMRAAQSLKRKQEQMQRREQQAADQELNAAFESKFGTANGHLRHDTWWLAPFSLAHTLVLVGGLNLVGAGSSGQPLLACLWQLIILMIIVKVDPFRTPANNRTAIASTLSLMLMLLAGFALFVDAPAQPGRERTTGNARTFSDEFMTLSTVSLLLLLPLLVALTVGHKWAYWVTVNVCRQGQRVYARCRCCHTPKRILPPRPLSPLCQSPPWLRDDELNGFPVAAYCPITLQLMKDPWMDKDGFSYEKDAIFDWVEKYDGASPVTRDPLNKADIQPNHRLRDFIKRLHAKSLEAREKAQAEAEAEIAALRAKAEAEMAALAERHENERAANELMRELEAALESDDAALVAAALQKALDLGVDLELYFNTELLTRGKQTVREAHLISELEMAHFDLERLREVITTAEAYIREERQLSSPSDMEEFDGVLEEARGQAAVLQQQASSLNACQSAIREEDLRELRKAMRTAQRCLVAHNKKREQEWAEVCAAYERIKGKEKEMQERRLIALRNHKNLTRDLRVAEGVGDLKRKIKQKKLIDAHLHRQKTVGRVKLYM
jgi:hypothetical protein